MTVVMMGQMSLDNSVEKSDKKNDEDQVDGMITRMSDQVVSDQVFVASDRLKSRLVNVGQVQLFEFSRSGGPGVGHLQPQRY